MDTKGELNDRRPKPQETTLPRDQYDQDLHPEPLAGQNIGPLSMEREVPIRTAFDVKEVHRALADLGDDDLRQIPILEIGTRLQQGATYLDLADATREPFRATGSQEVRVGQFIVPKGRVPYQIWDRIAAVER